MRTLAGLAISLLLFVVGGFAQEAATPGHSAGREGAAPSEALLASLRAAVVPLDTVDPDAPLDDLESLRDVIGDARIVALGEATHGTSEFFRFKHRMVRFLAEELGFTIFAIEANLPEAYRLNRFVLTGEGDPRELLAGMYFWTWNTREVLDLIAWMRAYNASGRGVMQFTGFDLQFPQLAMAEVRAFFERHDPAYMERFDELQEVVNDAYERQRTCASRCGPYLEAWLDAGQEVRQRLERPSAYPGATPAEIAWARQNARVVVQSVEMRGLGASRDASMAENVTWILGRNPDAKAVLWAHDLHVAEAAFQSRSMGSALAERYGGDYLSVGFSFYEGRYTALENRRSDAGPQSIVAPPAAQGSVGAVFAAVGPPIFTLDLRALDGTEAGVWLSQPQPRRFAGAVAAPADRELPLDVLRDDFDVVVFIETSTATDVLFVPPGPSRERR